MVWTQSATHYKLAGRGILRRSSLYSKAIGGQALSLVMKLALIDHTIAPDQTFSFRSNNAG